MKKIFMYISLMVIALVLLTLNSCATATYEKEGTKITVKRPIFAAMNVSWTDGSGAISASSSVQLDQLMALAIQGYAKYMSGGIAPVTPVPNPTVGPTTGAVK